MQTIQKFVSDDGLEFVDRQACIRYEAMCKEVAEIMSKLPAIPELPGCGFANGDGYLQHDPVVAKAARDALLRIANTIMPHKWFQQTLDGENVHASRAGRLISEMSEKCVWQAWHRFSCMTADWREYGQPFYANNPDKASDVCLNPKP